MHAPTPGKSSKLLPANAYTKLPPGEEYRPIVAAGDRRAEVTPWSIATGLVMVAVFSAACVYLALRAGNAIEAAIPIAILAIFFGKLRTPRSTILENVIVQSVGQAAGVVAAGAAFLIPALYINRLEVQWWQIFLSCFIGGALGVVLIVPLRKYFVKDLHGELPFPEATAINEILVSGESQGKTAGKILLFAFVLGAAFDFLIEAVHLWNPMITSKALLGSIGLEMSAKFRLDLSMSGLAALFGLGYLIGLKYAATIAAGSVLSCLILVPVVYLFGSQVPSLAFAGKTFQIAGMKSADLFANLVKPIGIGAIAISGLIGIMRMGKIVAGSVTLGFKGLGGRRGGDATERTNRDMHPAGVLLIQFLSVVLMAGLFYLVAKTTVADPVTKAVYTDNQALTYALVGAGAGFLLSFLFTPVAAQAIAIVGVNPVSGMTLITVVLTIVTLVAVGLKGTGGMFVALIVGCAVCTALSTSGALISDFKIGYWIGSTPRSQQVWKFLGLLVAALVVAGVIPLMDSAYHFVVESPAGSGSFISNDKVLPAPQANMLAVVSKGLLMDPANQPWLLYGLGGLMAITLYMASVPMLAFALGMYLPIQVNMAVLFGAFCAWLIGQTGGSQEVRGLRREQGTLIASGLVAGAAIAGILTALLRQTWLGAPIRFLSLGERFWIDETPIASSFNVRTPDWGAYTWIDTAPTGTFLNSRELHWYEGATGQGLAMAAFVALAIACYALAVVGTRGIRREQAEAGE